MKWKETPWPRPLRAKVIRISERCFSTKPNALFNNRIEIENLEKNSITTMTATYIDCFLKIQLKRKEKRRKNPTQQPILCMKYGWWNDEFWFLFTYICSYNYIIINTRWLLRFEFQLPHPILRPALATDKKWPLSQFHISYQNSEISWPKAPISKFQSPHPMSTRSKGISSSKRKLGIEVATRSFQVNRNLKSIS